jgi:hypothetical protein
MHPQHSTKSMHHPPKERFIPAPKIHHQTHHFHKPNNTNNLQNFLYRLNHVLRRINYAKNVQKGSEIAKKSTYIERNRSENVCVAPSCFRFRSRAGIAHKP